MAEIHLSIHKREILCHCGYIYYTYVKNKGKSFWTCKERKCQARATSVNIDGEPKVDVTREHTHSPQHVQVAILRLKANLRRKAVEEYEVDPQYLIHQEIRKLPAEARAALPQMRNFRRLIRDCRLSLQPNLNDLLIPSSHLKTLSGREFLLHDNIINNEVDQTTQRTVIFATEDNLRMLFASDIWYVDGTFKIEGTVFLQVWTIHGRVKESIFPLVYVFMQTKREDEYLGTLLRLQQKAVGLHISNQPPSTVMVDSSKDAINALRIAFPKAHICMCLSQYKQSLHNKIQVLRLQAGYSTAVRHWLWCVVGLAYVPLADVVEAFQILLNQLENDKNQLLVGLEEVASYLDRNYVHGQLEIDTTQVQPPIYPVEMWNIYERTLTNKVIADIVIEEWYAKFNKTVCQCSGTLHLLLQAIRIEQNTTETILFGTKIDQQEVDQVVTKKKMSQIEEIRDYVIRYEEFKSADRILQYLKTMGSYNTLPMI